MGTSGSARSRKRFRWARGWRLLSALALVLMLFGNTLSFSSAATADPSGVSFKLEGCKNDGTITLPNGSGQFICPDSVYTTGNLGKGWNELDLVPYRLTASAGNSAPSTQTYAVAVAVDAFDAGHPGYDVLSTLTLNTALSTSGGASCQISVGPQTTLSPGVGGIDQSLYRILTITQPKNTDCVYDFYARLALGSHLFPGSSLHADLLNQNLGTGGIGSKDVSIPVKEISPQSLSKDMSASEGADYAWNITKSATPANLSFGNTCDTGQPLSQGVQVTVTWTKLPATLGAITVVTHVYATNPASRSITTTATDVIYSGTTQLSTKTSDPTVVPANTANFLILTDTQTVPAGTTNLNDVATGTYIDTATGIPISGTTTAAASATVQVTATNASATINDVESITGSGLSYSVDSFSGASGSFDGGYVAGTKTTGNVSWTSSSQSGSGAVTFNKTVYATAASSVTGNLHDVATLTGSDGFTTSASLDVPITVNAQVSLTINKSLAPALSSGSVTFTFHVRNAVNVEVATPTITFNAGDTSKSVTVSNLAAGSYTVSEDPVSGFTTDSPKSVTITLPSCSGSVSFSNLQQFSPTLSTTPNPTSATVGATLNDSATLSGAYNPTGSIVFNLFGPSDATCAGPALYTQTVALNGTSAATSPGFTTAAPGTYRWTASYAGDTYNSAASSGCQAEQVTVTKATPTLTTNASSPVTVGQAIHDVATLGGGFNPTGSITFDVFAPGDTICATPINVPPAQTVNGAGNYTSGDYTTAAAGTYLWIAHYSGDANNNAVDTACNDPNESSAVNKASPSITTQASPTSGTVGQQLTVGDTATISGGFNPSGAVTFKLYSDSKCTVSTGVSGNGNISGGSASFSNSWTPSATGTYYWIASYAGDANNNGFTTGCGDANEQLVINPVSPTISTQASPTSGTVGQQLTVSDTATFNGAVNPTGSVTFTLYSDNQCTVPVPGVSGTGTITNGTATFSTSWTPTAAGTYYWQATYPGDSNNNAYTAPCVDANEQIVIGKASPSITTQASPTTGTVGQPLTVGDTATISNAFNPSGSVTFTLYSDSKCTITAGVTGSGPISGGSASFSTSWTPAAAGTYYWIASYAGDSNNNGFTTGCGDANEQIVINKAGPSIATSATDASGASTSVSDSATLSGGFNPTGSITFKLYGPSATPSCTSANLVFTSSAVAVNGNGTYGPVSFSPAAVGTYYWIASYSGDANNSAVSGSCGDQNETSKVNPGSAKVVKTVQGQPPSGTQDFSFQLRQGASSTDVGTILETEHANAANGGVVNFTTSLVPGQTYQMCEIVMPAWLTNLGTFVPNSFNPPDGTTPNPNVDNSILCVNFTAQAGQTTTFNVDNTPPPGGRALTIGFWKNWASCATSNGKQKPVLDQTLATATSSTTNPPGGLVVSAQNIGSGWPNFAASYYLVLKGDPSNPNVAPDCSKAVNLLSKTTIDGKTKKASDPLFNMTAQLVAAQLNYFAGAGKNGTTTVNINRAVVLLGKYQFNGLTYSPKLSTADTATANCLATQLDNYNNDRSVSTCP